MTLRHNLYPMGPCHTCSCLERQANLLALPSKFGKAGPSNVMLALPSKFGKAGLSNVMPVHEHEFQEGHLVLGLKQDKMRQHSQRSYRLHCQLLTRLSRPEV